MNRTKETDNKGLFRYKTQGVSYQLEYVIRVLCGLRTRWLILGAVRVFILLSIYLSHLASGSKAQRIHFQHIFVNKFHRTRNIIYISCKCCFCLDYIYDVGFNILQQKTLFTIIGVFHTIISLYR